MLLKYISNGGLTSAAYAAKITPQKSQNSAETKFKRKATNVMLENEGDNLIYTVVIGSKEFKEVAGNGQVLAIDKMNNGQDEVKTLRSSIEELNIFSISL